MVHQLCRHFADANRARRLASNVGVDHPGQQGRRALGPNDTVAKSDDEIRLTDETLGCRHGVARAERFRLAEGHLLPGEEELDAALAIIEAPHLAHVAAVELEVNHQFGVIVEVVLDGDLAAARHKENAPDAGADELLDDVVDYGQTPGREHLLGHGLGRRQQACAQASNGYDSAINGHETEYAGSLKGGQRCRRRRARRPLSNGLTPADTRDILDRSAGDQIAPLADPCD